MIVFSGKTESMVFLRGKDMPGKLKVLFSCIGRRVSLLKSFRASARRLGIKSSFYGADKTELSAALRLCDECFVVRPIEQAGYISQLLSIVKSKKVRLLIPTVDLDLKMLSRNIARFGGQDCRVLVSNPRVVDICQDKRKTYRFLFENGFDTPATFSLQEALTTRKLKWPCFIKPWDGFASRGNAVVRNRGELKFFGKQVPNAICQEYINGQEFTCDVYVDFDMNVRCVVPRKRIEVRAGEVSKGQVVKHRLIMKEAARLVQRLGAGPGVITLQLFLTKEDRIKFIEINPRFGGGVPLSIKAGANFPRWILQELLGQKPGIRFDGFKDKLVMLRYDSEVWYEVD